MPRTRLPIAERMLHHLARGLCALPPRVQTRLAGGPVERDGQQLDPQMAILIRASEWIGKQEPESPAHLRVEQHRGARIAGFLEPDRSARDLEVGGAAGPLRARLYPRAAGERGAPLLVFFHGGGFVFGDIDTHDGPCRTLADHGGVSVLAVEYRLAPEHRFPSAVDDALAAFRWAQAHASELGADPARIGVGGDSAGGNLSAVVSQLTARDGKGAPPVAQVLVYPATDRRRAWRSLDLFGKGFYLESETVDWYYRQYAGEAADTAPDPRLNPLASKDLAGLAPALVVTAGFDPLRDEGEAYAEALRKAGSAVTLRRFPGLVHGFFNMVGISSSAREAVVEIAGATRILFSA